jgi:hypothetical protein
LLKERKNTKLKGSRTRGCSENNNCTWSSGKATTNRPGNQQSMWTDLRQSTRFTNATQEVRCQKSHRNSTKGRSYCHSAQELGMVWKESGFVRGNQVSLLKVWKESSFIGKNQVLLERIRFVGKNQVLLEGIRFCWLCCKYSMMMV